MLIPEEALNIAQDLKSKKSDWACTGEQLYLSSEEPIMEPPVRFKNATQVCMAITKMTLLYLKLVKFKKIRRFITIINNATACVFHVYETLVELI